jgi:transcriptional regulator with XRE-family HTH domain
MIEPVKRTPEDDIFAEQFGERLEEAYKTAKAQGITDQVFAEAIGVERPQLRKYFRGQAVPSVRTVALAQRRYGVSVPYARVDTGTLLGSRPRRQPQPKMMQLRLPFSIEGGESGDYDVEVRAIKPRKYELRIRTKRA